MDFKLNLNGVKELLKKTLALVRCIISTNAKLIETKPKVIVHKNKWHWGTSYTTVTSDGLGVHTMGIEKGQNSCFFGSIIVHESKRHKGVGKMLHQIAEERARHLGLESIEFVTDSNAWMKEWYLRMGYKIIKINDDGTVTMKKTL